MYDKDTINKIDALLINDFVIDDTQRQEIILSMQYLTSTYPGIDGTLTVVDEENLKSIIYGMIFSSSTESKISKYKTAVQISKIIIEHLKNK